MFVEQTNVCRSNFQVFLESRPNEKGDTLAGLAGSLAFLWIVITVLLQGKELSLQRQELERMRGVQEEQNGYLKSQNDREQILLQDKNIRTLVDVLRSLLPDLAFAYFELRSNDETLDRERPVWFYGKGTRFPEGPNSIREVTEAIEVVHKTVRHICKVNEMFVSNPELPKSWHIALTAARDISKKIPLASEGVQEWVLYELKIPSLERALREAIGDETIWALERKGDA